MLSKIDVKKSTGFDNIPAKFLKIGAGPLAGILSNLINLSFQECIFPDMLKYAELAALFKKSERIIKENYRPVSVLTALSKLFERTYSGQLSNFFDNILSKFLSAFRKKYSCQTALLRMIEDWKKSIDSGELVGTVAIDLSRAFDSLPHGLLVAKLYAYGVDLLACKLIASYLYNRKQRVKIKDKRSDWSTLEKGVPQGSVLGPLLFNIYINDIFFFTENCNLYNYADDNVASYAGTNVDQIRLTLTRETNSLMDWFCKNSLAANPSKFQAMLVSNIASRDKDFCITIDKTDILSLDSMTILGVCIDKRLNFNEHISLVCAKAAKQINVLQRLKGVLDKKSRLAIYNSFIMSNFNYCPVVWMFSSKSSLSKLEDLQRRALRFVLDDYVSNYDVLLTKSDVPGIKITLLRYLAIEVFKCVKEINPVYLNSLFLKKSCSYKLRDSSILSRPKVKSTNHGLKSFRSYGAKIWNTLPEHCKSAVSLQDFKIIIKTWKGPNCKCTVCNLFT